MTALFPIGCRVVTYGDYSLHGIVLRLAGDCEEDGSQLYRVRVDEISDLPYVTICESVMHLANEPQEVK